MHTEIVNDTLSVEHVLIYLDSGKLAVFIPEVDKNTSVLNVFKSVDEYKQAFIDATKIDFDHFEIEHN